MARNRENSVIQLCPGRDSNPYDRFQSGGFKPPASAIPPPRREASTDYAA